MITESNLKMAERLLAKESFFDHKAMRRSIDEYEQVKRTMNNNRRILFAGSPDRTSLPALPQKKDMSSPNNLSVVKRGLKEEEDETCTL